MAMRRRAQFVLLVIILSILCWCSGCASQTSDKVYAKEGKEYGKVKGAFRHRWWNKVAEEE